jgi:gluconolactonase
MKPIGLCLWLAAAVLGGPAAHASGLDGVIAAGARVEKIAHGLRFAEGPVWDRKGGLLFSDIPADTIYRWTPKPPARRGRAALPVALEGSLRVFRRPAGLPNGLAWDGQGRLIVCEHERRVSVIEADGTVHTLADRFEGKRLNSPNDLAVRKDGSIYFTDPPYGLANPKLREIGFSGIYRIAPNGALSVVEKKMAFPNGLAFSPDQSKLYVVESEQNQIRVFDVAPDGSLSNSRLFADVNLPGSHEGPDGIKVDAHGNVFCAGPDGVWVLSPDGRLLGMIPTPEVPSNLAFGDADNSALYVTARSGLYRIRLKK